VPRRTTPVARLARLGFADAARAQRLLTEDLEFDPDGADTGIVRALAEAADPDLALAALARLPRDEDLLAALRADPALRRRLAAVLGASAALGDHLARHPGHWRMLQPPDGAPAAHCHLPPPQNCARICWPRWGRGRRTRRRWPGRRPARGRTR
jgi:glutamate-ammonia-ligase adenylyltransferase